MSQSKIELIGPMKIMNLKMLSMSQRRGEAMDSSSTLSVGIAVWEKS
jgi:hypothetical protein